jgi:hypothetical protein
MIKQTLEDAAMWIAKGLSLTLMLVSFTALGQDDDNTFERYWPEDEVVAAETLPAHVMATIKANKPRAFITEVQRQFRSDDTLYYRVKASEVSRFWVLLIRDDGELIELYEQPAPPS